MTLSLPLSLASLVRRVDAHTIQIHRPHNPTQCEPVKLDWSGGTPPFLVHVETVCEAAVRLATFTNISKTSVTWFTNASAETVFRFTVDDASGVNGASAYHTVLIGFNDTTCLSEDQSTTATCAPVLAESHTSVAGSAYLPIPSAYTHPHSSTTPLLVLDAKGIAGAAVGYACLILALVGMYLWMRRRIGTLRRRNGAVNAEPPPTPFLVPSPPDTVESSQLEDGPLSLLGDTNAQAYRPRRNILQRFLRMKGSHLRARTSLSSTSMSVEATLRPAMRSITHQSQIYSDARATIMVSDVNASDTSTTLSAHASDTQEPARDGPSRQPGRRPQRRETDAGVRLVGGPPRDGVSVGTADLYQWGNGSIASEISSTLPPPYHPYQ